MENEHNEIVLHVASDSQREDERVSKKDCSLIPEDERITQPLSSMRLENDGAQSTVDHSVSFYQLACTDCDGHLVGVKPPPPNNQLSVRLDSVAASDQLLIDTEQSAYVFTMIDPNLRIGRLTGGILGNRSLTAYLFPSQEKPNASTDETLITIGDKLGFVFESGHQIERLTTSVVTRVVHRRGTRKPAHAIEQPAHCENLSISR